MSHHPDGLPFADLELSRRLERTEGHSGSRWVEARARAFPDSGSQWIDVGGTYLMYDGPSSPSTQTFGLGLFSQPTAAQLTEIEQFFTERQAPVYHEVSPLADASLAGLLAQRGYRPFEYTSVMYRVITRGGDRPPNRNPRITVRAIEPREQGVWTDVSIRGWRQEFAGSADFFGQMGPVAAVCEDAVSYLAELERTAIAAGTLYLHGNVALLGGACTVPEARNQGAQLALLDGRLQHAAEVGCDLAMMCAAPGSASQRNAERNGFRIAYTRTKWQLQHGAPPEPAAGH